MFTDDTTRRSLLGDSAGDTSAPCTSGCLSLQEAQRCELISVCTKAKQTDKQHSMENVRISTLTLHSTMLPLTPFLTFLDEQVSISTEEHLM